MKESVRAIAVDRWFCEIISTALRKGSVRDVCAAVRLIAARGDEIYSLVHLGYWAGTLAEEKALQERFAIKRVRGEWFRLEPTDIAELSRNFQPQEAA